MNITKTLAAIAVAGCAVTGFSSVESANIVGYNGHDKTEKQYVCVGVGFENVAKSGVFKLSDIKPSAWNSSSDTLQVLRPSNASVSTKYIYYGEWEGADPELDEPGWYLFGFEGDAKQDNVEFPIGTAFLGNFAEKDVKFQQSGAVLIGGSTFDFRPDEEKGIEGKQYVMLGNPLPKEIKLGDIKPISWNSSSDTLQVLRPSNASVSTKYIYYGEWEGADPALDEPGWYLFGFEGDAKQDNVPVYPGDAWLGNFAEKDVALTFPGALD